ncbi:MAG: NAD+ synthase [Candidatus Helarchaeota archaeon]
MTIPNIEKELERILKFIQIIKKNANAAGFVVGLSGGIDSALTATLCVRASNEDSVLGLLMPCHSSEADLADAKIMVEFLGIKHLVVDLSDTFDQFMKTIKDYGTESSFKLAKANIKPRLRMITLYFFANLNNYLVAGTGNKSEDDIGYFTKYGDGGVDFLPIQHLYKHEVRQLARYLGIPEKIIKRTPTAGLWEGQTDEDELSNQLGFTVTYEKLDEMLEEIHQKRHPKDDDKYVALMNRMKSSRHKIEPIPALDRRFD